MLPQRALSTRLVTTLSLQDDSLSALRGGPRARLRWGAPATPHTIFLDEGFSAGTPGTLPACCRVCPCTVGYLSAALTSTLGCQQSLVVTVRHISRHSHMSPGGTSGSFLTASMSRPCPGRPRGHREVQPSGVPGLLGRQMCRDASRPQEAGPCLE